MRRLGAILLIGASLAGLIGCGADLKSLGVGRQPFIQFESVEFSDAEKGELLAIRQAHPALFDKLQQYSAQNAAAIQAYNRRALEVNLKQLKALGYSDDEIKSLRDAWIAKYHIRELQE